ncbi:hypothetical protein Droror1_Dr00017528 [Drosera rotundifolia]
MKAKWVLAICANNTESGNPKGTTQRGRDELLFVTAINAMDRESENTSHGADCQLANVPTSSSIQYQSKNPIFFTVSLNWVPQFHPFEKQSTRKQTTGTLIGMRRYLGVSVVDKWLLGKMN